MAAVSDTLRILDVVGRRVTLSTEPLIAHRGFSARCCVWNHSCARRRRGGLWGVLRACVRACVRAAFVCVCACACSVGRGPANRA